MIKGLRIKFKLTAYSLWLEREELFVEEAIYYDPGTDTGTR